MRPLALFASLVLAGSLALVTGCQTQNPPADPAPATPIIVPVRPCPGPRPVIVPIGPIIIPVRPHPHCPR